MQGIFTKTSSTSSTSSMSGSADHAGPRGAQYTPAHVQQALDTARIGGGPPRQGFLRGAVLLNKHPDMMMAQGTKVDHEQQRRNMSFIGENKNIQKKDKKEDEEEDDEEQEEEDDDDDSQMQEDSDEVNAREKDLQYARLVCGGTGFRNMGLVWGPVLGSGLNYVDNKFLQDRVFDHIRDVVSDQIAQQTMEDQRKRKRGRKRPEQRRNPSSFSSVAGPVDPAQSSSLSGGLSNVSPFPGPIQPASRTNATTDLQYSNGRPMPNLTVMDRATVETSQRGGRAKTIPLMRNLGGLARQVREEFNIGWNNVRDMGITNEVVNAEVQVIQTLRLQFGSSSDPIQVWDSLFPSVDPMPRSVTNCLFFIEF